MVKIPQTSQQTYNSDEPLKNYDLPVGSGEQCYRVEYTISSDGYTKNWGCSDTYCTRAKGGGYASVTHAIRAANEAKKRIIKQTHQSATDVIYEIGVVKYCHRPDPQD